LSGPRGEREVKEMKILVAVDASPESHNALRYVCHLLDQFDARVDAIHVKRDVSEITLEDFDVPFLKRKDPAGRIEEASRDVQREIVDACEVCLAGRVPCEPHVVVGEPVDRILQAAREGDYDLVVLGSHGFSSLKGFLLGTVHTKILHHASLPVLIVREMREIRKVLVAYRGSRCDQAALRFVAPLFGRRQPEVTVLHVQETALGESDGFAAACLTSGRRTLEAEDLRPETRAIQGDFVDETLKEVLTGDHDLVVLGAYGHERSRLLKVISDEALNIVSRTLRPVLVYRDKGE
jgi:nucleotide-binding universal stress UspA family protein